MDQTFALSVVSIQGPGRGYAAGCWTWKDRDRKYGARDCSPPFHRYPCHDDPDGGTAGIYAGDSDNNGNVWQGEKSTEASNHGMIARTRKKYDPPKFLWALSSRFKILQKQERRHRCNRDARAEFFLVKSGGETRGWGVDKTPWKIA